MAAIGGNLYVSSGAVSLQIGRGRVLKQGGSRVAGQCVYNTGPHRVARDSRRFAGRLTGSELNPLEFHVRRIYGGLCNHEVTGNRDDGPSLHPSRPSQRFDLGVYHSAIYIWSKYHAARPQPLIGGARGISGLLKSLF